MQNALRALSLTVFFALMAGFAHAKTWPSVGWFDFEETDNACIAYVPYSFDGRSDVHLFLGYQTDGRVMLMLSSYDWSAVEGQAYNDIEFELNNVVYSQGAIQEPTVVGVAISGYGRGFASVLNPSFLDDFAAGSSLYVTKADAVLTHVNLKGSAQAVTVLRRCQADLKARQVKAEQEKARWNYIEKDPFAQQPDTETGKSASPE